MCKRNINLPVLFMITFSGYNAFTVCIIPSPLNPKAFPGRIPERNTCSLYMNNTCKYTVVLVSFSKYRTICLVKFALLNRETRQLHNYKPTCKAHMLIPLLVHKSIVFGSASLSIFDVLHPTKGYNLCIHNALF